MAYLEQMHFHKFPGLPVMVCILEMNGYYSVGTSFSPEDRFDEREAARNAELHARRNKAKADAARAERRAEAFADR